MFQQIIANRERRKPIERNTMATPKKGRIYEAYKAYKKSRSYSLNDVYSRYSLAKDHAMQKCRDKYIRDNGYDFRIVGYNSQFFSVGYKVCDKKGKEIFVWITPWNVYTMEL